MKVTHYKEITKDLPITILPAPEYLYIPLVQHIGAPALPLVKPGDMVLAGQLIASADAFVTANVHSSVSGKIEEMVRIKNPQGQLIEAFKIKNDYKYVFDPKILPKKTLAELTAFDIRDIARESGLVGMGGATFPTHVKLSPPDEKKIDIAILNAAECEPFLTADHRLLLEKTRDVLFGFQAIAKAVGAEKLYIGIEDNKLDAVEKLKAVGALDFAEIKIIKSEYPAGAEKVLVKKVTGRKVPNKGIPLDVGVLVSNVSTAYQLALTLLTGSPLTERVVTVSGEFANPGNYLVKIGTKLKDIVKIPEKYLSGKESYRVVIGGPMMGYAVEDLDLPVSKGLSGIVLLPTNYYEESNCIRCGRCVDACPLGLKPYQDRGCDECMECGICAFNCPAHRFLVQNSRLQKKKMKAGAK